MLSKNQIQFVKSLTINKYRNLHKRFIAEGPKLVEDLLGSSYQPRQLFGVSDWVESHQETLPSDLQTTKVSSKELKRISALKTPNQVLAVVEIPEINQPIIPVDHTLLMLDGISDPGNMGTIIRTADWFGIKNIICSENCVDIYNSKVVQATMGSIFRLNIFNKNLEHFLQNLPKNIPVYGTLLEGSNLFSTKINEPGIIIIGNESKGISSQIIPYITKRIRIPDYSASKTNSAESLNAAIATAIVLAEFRKRSS